MSHLIEKHQQNNKGRGVIRRKSLLSPEQEIIAQNRTNLQSLKSDAIAESTKTTRDNANNQRRTLATKQAIREDLKKNPIPSLLTRRVTVASTTNPDDVRTERMVQTSRGKNPQFEERKENPNRRVSDELLQQYYNNQELEKRFVEEVLPATGEFISTIIPGSKHLGYLYGKATGDDTRSFADLMFGTNKGLDNHVLNIAADVFTPGAAFKLLKSGSKALGYVPKIMRFYNSPLTGKWTQFGNKVYRINPNFLGSGGGPLDEDLVVFPSRKKEFDPILKSDLPEYLRMLRNGEFEIMGSGGWKMYKLGNRQPIRHDILKGLLDLHLLKRTLTSDEIELAKQAPTLIAQMNKNYRGLGEKFRPENWFSNRPWIGSNKPDAVTQLDIDIWNSHIHEYSQLADKLINEGKLIPQSNGSWLGKFSDGTRRVLPEEYIVAHSNSFVNNGWKYDGINKGRAMTFKEYENWLENGGLGDTKWTTDSRDLLGIFSSEGYRRDGRTVLTIVGNSDDIELVPAEYAREARRVEHGIQYSSNVDYKGVKGNYTVYGEDIPVKSLRGNNGDYSNIRQGIYKVVVPTILGGTFFGNYLNNL